MSSLRAYHVCLTTIIIHLLTIYQLNTKRVNDETKRVNDETPLNKSQNYAHLIEN